MKSIENDYIVISADYSKVDYVINIEDERALDICLEQAISFTKPVRFECLDFESLSQRCVDFDISIDNEILFSKKYIDVFKKHYLHKNSINPAFVGDKECIYLHCYNIIDCIDGDELDFELIKKVPVSQRVVFKPSIGSILTFFHKDFVSDIIKVAQPKDVKLISLSKWSLQWELS